MGVVLLLVGSRGSLDAHSPGGGADQKDLRPLYQAMLEWAVLDKPLPGQSSRMTFPDRGLIKDAPLIRISSKHLPPDIRLALPGRQIEILPEERLEQLAQEMGEFPAFHFGEVKTSGEYADMELALRWYTPKDPKVVPLSGGGVRIRFRWQEGGWRFEKRLGMWIS